MPAARGSRKRCKDCGSQFVRASGSNRLFCETCRPSRARPVEAEGGMVVDFPERTWGKVERLTLQTLAEVGREETWQGAVALELAKLIDSGKHGASGAAGNVKAHREAMAEAMRGASKADDPLDDLYKDEAQ